MSNRRSINQRLSFGYPRNQVTSPPPPPANRRTPPLSDRVFSPTLESPKRSSGSSGGRPRKPSSESTWRGSPPDDFEEYEIARSPRSPTAPGWVAQIAEPPHLPSRSPFTEPEDDDIVPMAVEPFLESLPEEAPPVEITRFEDAAMPFERVTEATEELRCMLPPQHEDYDIHGSETQSPIGRERAEEAPSHYNPSPCADIPAVQTEGPQGQDIMGRHHDKYFLGDGDLVLFVDGTLYKLHRFIFSDSPTLSRRFSGDGQGIDAEIGYIGDHPIYTLGIRAQDFDTFLTALYPSYRPKTYETAELKSILKYADMWAFSEIREYTIELLRERPLSLVEKVELAVNYHVDGTLLDVYVDLCSNLSVPDEAIVSILSRSPDLGISTFVKLCEARQRVFQHLYRLAGMTEPIYVYDCLQPNTPCHPANTHCHRGSLFLGVLKRALDKVLGQNVLIHEYIVAVIRQDHFQCSYCSAALQQRVCTFLELDDIRAIVGDVMFPPAPSVVNVGEPEPAASQNEGPRSPARSVRTAGYPSPMNSSMREPASYTPSRAVSINSYDSRMESRRSPPR